MAQGGSWSPDAAPPSTAVQRVEWWVPGVSGRGDGEFLFNGDQISVLQDHVLYNDIVPTINNVPLST